MKLVFRAFCRIPVIKSPMSAYLTEIKDKNFVADILKKQREEIPKFKDQQSLLKDLELASIFRMKEFSNQRLLSVIKAYSLMNQGSSQLYETISKQIKKRINSFTLEELSTIVYFLSTVPGTFEILDIIHALFISDPLEIPAEVIGKLSFAYSLQKPESLQLHRALANIFMISKEKVSAENGFLLLTGFYKINYNDHMLVPHIEE